jgi:psiF repeat
MARSRIFLAAAILLAVSIAAPAAQAQAPSADSPKQSRLKLTRERIDEMIAKWKANRPKFKACRTEVRKKGLAGDDRWFFMSECMDKS